jgi:hypothetical protein
MRTSNKKMNGNIPNKTGQMEKNYRDWNKVEKLLHSNSNKNSKATMTMIFKISET